MGVLFSCPVEEEEDMPAGAALPAPGCGGGGNAGVEPTALKPSLAGSGKLRFERSLGSLIRREQQSPSARLQVDATKIPATSPRATVAPVQPVMPRELARTRVRRRRGRGPAGEPQARGGRRDGAEGVQELPHAPPPRRLRRRRRAELTF
ncbi:unnamed protein product [Miscanthus lutarioriparius]|uniref:Uncharacterized protein n=1 Tax=Miscanthus lutarioriparius TaxID=422564 RepID=A0A811N1Y0_9POAL|nr:unnamed protein product [Miscanthus lutarioriparius]